MLITHDLGVVAETCTRMITMYAGEVIEDAAGRRRAAPAAPSLHVGPFAFVAAPQPAPRHAAVDSGPCALDLDMPTGCRFRARCMHAADGCESEQALIDAAAAARCAAGASRSSICRARCNARSAPIECGGAMTPHAPHETGRHRLGARSRGPLSDERSPRHREGSRRSELRRPPRRDLGIIGESGSGKTTIGRALVFLLTPSARRHPAQRHRPASLAAPRLSEPPARLPDHLSGPQCRAQSAHDDHLIVLEPLELAREGTEASGWRGRARRWIVSGCRMKPPSAIRTSFRAARSSAC